jgi:diguanylate cyclase (GGDEF)-like protein
MFKSSLSTLMRMSEIARPKIVDQLRLEDLVPAGALRILLVEDNPGDERLVRLALSVDPNWEFQVSSAETLTIGLRMAQSTGFDAILLDMQLPDGNGLANVKELALAAPRTPIVVLTGLEDDFLAMQVSLHGAQDYRIKGKDDPASLSRAIRCAIGRKRFEAVLAQRAHFDSLTGLVNRGLFNDRLNQALARATRTDQFAAVLFIDLDNFKKINDSHGHKVGDEVLRAVADSLRSAVRQTDTVARLGGDEFTVLLEPLDDLAHANVVANKILAVLSTPIFKRGVEVNVTASIGIATFPKHARKADGLIHSADTMMLLAKRCGGNRFRLAARD